MTINLTSPKSIFKYSLIIDAVQVLIYYGIGVFQTHSFAEGLHSLMVMPWYNLLLVPLVILGSLWVSNILHTVVHEGGHLVMGLLSGYKFLSFQMLGLTLVNEDGHLRFKRHQVLGANGQCLMMPPDGLVKDVPVIGYLLGGVLFNGLLVALCVTLFFIIKPMPLLLALFLGITILDNLMVMWINGVPRCVGVPNDAYNIRAIKHDPKVGETLVTLLKVNGMLCNGVRPRDIPAVYFNFTGEMDFDDPVTLNLFMLYAAHLVDSGKIEKARNIYQAIIDSNQSVTLFEIDAKCEIACMLMMEGRIDEARQLLNEYELNVIHMLSSSISSKQRYLCLRSLYIDNDPVTARAYFTETAENSDNYLVKGEVEMDLELMSRALN